MFPYPGPLNVEHPGDNDGEGFSPEIWGQSHLFEIASDKEAGWAWEDRFDDGKEAAGVYTKTTVTAGTFITDLAIAGGWGVVDSGSTTSGQGINVQYTHLGFIPRVDAVICFEGIFRFIDATVFPQFFFGLAASDTALITGGATGVIDQDDFIGFQCLTGDRILLGESSKANVTHSTKVTTVTVTENDTHADATTFKLGVVIDGITGATWFVDGKPIANSTTDGVSPNFIPGTHIPVVFMIPSIVVQTDGTDDPIVYAWAWRFSQFDRTVL